MKNKISWILLSLMLGGCGLLYYTWQQFTNLPGWYTNQVQSSIAAGDATLSEVINIQNPDEVQETKTKIEGKIAASLNMQSSQLEAGETEQASPFDNRPILTDADPNRVEIELDETELNALIVSNLAENEATRQILESVKGFNTTIKNGSLEAGVVVNFSDFNSEQLSASEREVFNKAIQTFPFIENRPIYIAIEGQPSLEDGQLQFDEGTKFKLGNISLSLSDISQKLGIPLEELQQKLNLNVQVENIRIRDIKFEGNRALVRGIVN